jgi:hypothetical protein
MDKHSKAEPETTGRKPENCPQMVLLSPRALAARWDTTEGALTQRRRRGSGPPFIRLGPKTVRYPLAGVEAHERDLPVFASIDEAQAARGDTAELEKERARIERARMLVPMRRKAASKNRP